MIHVNVASPIKELNRTIHKETDDRFFIARLGRSWKAISAKNGICYGIGTGIVLAVSKIYAAFFSTLCIEGSVRSFIDTHEAGTVARPLGDAGGWTALAIFGFLAIGTVSIQLIREGEYFKLKKICSEWIKKHPDYKQELYPKMERLLRDFSTQCFFPKRPIARRLTAIKILSCASETLEDKELSIDRRLQTIYQAMKNEIKDATSTKKYFQRFYHGQKSFKKGGCSRQSSSLILGVVMPILLLGCAVLSALGEIPLALEVWKDQHDPTSVGHLGEWPINLIEALVAAIFFHVMCILAIGDFCAIKKICIKHLKTLEGEPELYNRLVDLANEELNERATSLQFFKLPTEYYFEKINC